MNSQVFYRLTFYNRSNSIDRTEEYETDAKAREVMNRYNIIDGGELYSKISLSRVSLDEPGKPNKLAELSFPTC